MDRHGGGMDFQFTAKTAQLHSNVSKTVSQLRSLKTVYEEPSILTTFKRPNQYTVQSNTAHFIF